LQYHTVLRDQAEPIELRLFVLSCNDCREERKRYGLGAENTKAKLPEDGLRTQLT